MRMGLAQKKLFSILVNEVLIWKVCVLAPQTGIIYNGMGPDSRVLVQRVTTKTKRRPWASLKGKPELEETYLSLLVEAMEAHTSKEQGCLDFY